MDVDQIGPRKTLAQHHHEKGNHAEAERFARMALEIDATDRECQRILVESLTGLNRAGEAERLSKVFGL